MTTHAILSPSSADRWLHCTPSAVLEASRPDTAGPAAQQGTAAHALAEHKLKRALKKRSRKPVSEWLDDDMETHTDAYVDYIMEQVAEATHPLVLIEQRLDMTPWVPDGFGTGDCVIVADGLLHVIDLKYGQGVLVDAVDNPQAKLYALGALWAFEPLYDGITEVNVTIFQPRRNNVSTWSINRNELMDWAENVLVERAKLAAAGGGDFNAGPWCRFCRISATCRARAEANLALAQKEFKSAPELTDDEIAEVLALAPQLANWANDVQAWALTQAVNSGKQWSGFKLVEGRAIRKFVDENDVAQAAQDAGYTDIYDKKLITITAMEKLMGKATFTEILGDLVHKPAGKPTLAPETDKRPAISAGATVEFQPIQ